MHSLRSFAHWALTLAPFLLIAGCGCSGDTLPMLKQVSSNLAPSIVIMSPGVDTASSLGGQVVITYVDDDVDDVAMTDLYADVDGDLTTTGDQILIASQRPEQGGTMQTVVWDTTGVAPGTYTIIGVTTDEGPQVATDAGLGAIVVGDVAWARRDGGATITGAYHIDAFPDGSSVATGLFSGTSTFGAGEANETVLVSAGDFDGYVARYDPLGELVWARRMGGPAFDVGWGTLARPDGTSIVTGYFSDTADFGAGEPNETLLVSAGDYDAYVAKFDATGNLAWVKQMGGSGDDVGQAVAPLPDGGYVMTGWFEGTITMGAGEPNETSFTASGPRDIYVGRLDADGMLTWARRDGGPNEETAFGISALPDGSTVVVGFHQADSVFGVGESEETLLPSSGGDDCFLARYTPSGELTWIRNGGGPGGDRLWGVSTLADGSCIATGYFSDVATFGQGTPSETTLTSAGDTDVLVVRYDLSGELVWARSAGGPSGETSVGIDLRADGTFLIAGSFGDTAVFGPGEVLETTLVSAGSLDVFVARMDTSGQLLWARRDGGSDYDEGRGIGLAADGSVVTAGYFVSTATFGLGDPLETVLVAGGAVDAFVARLNADGTF